MKYKIITNKPFSVVDRAPTRRIAKEIIEEEKTSDLIKNQRKSYGIYDIEEGRVEWI